MPEPLAIPNHHVFINHNRYTFSIILLPYLYGNIVLGNIIVLF